MSMIPPDLMPVLWPVFTAGLSLTGLAAIVLVGHTLIVLLRRFD